MNTAPRKIEWNGPEGWTVWADEDGVHIRTARGDSLEMVEVEALFRLWSHACAAIGPGGVIEPPKPPSKEELRAMSAARNEAYTLRRAQRALEREFDTDPTPF